MNNKYFDIFLKKIKSVSKNQVARNFFIVGVVTLLVKIISFYKEALIARTFGLSELLDTFYLSILIPTFLQTVFIGSLKNLFIPNYIVESKKGNDVGSFQSVSFLIVLILVTILSLFALIFVQFFLELTFPGHDLKYYTLIRMQFYIVLPCIFFWGMASLISGLIEIKGKFLITSLTPIFTAFTTLICLFFYKDYLGDFVLAVGLLTGSITSFFVLCLYSRYKNLIILSKPQKSENISIMIKQLPPKIFSGLFTGLNGFVDQFFAAQLIVGSITAINYGIKIPSFVVGILIMAIGNVLLPHFSKLVVEDINNAYKYLFKVLKILFIVTLTITGIFVYFSEYIVWLLFEKDQFTSQDTQVVYQIQQIALIYIPFYLTTLVTVKFLTAINKNKFMAWTSLWNLVLNIILNIIFIKYYKVYGLVLSTTLVYIISSFIYFAYTIKQYKLQKLEI
ncbi:murein biosynthesis integral membrane protein MurJ [Cellulophaga baltica]|uniref:murein biosynthesis integral membrane protein MurJ n=1 Tax=Cellulophaga baltica TaxID=76594 RepID=UPI002494573D|nr:lipid II flippase MurJ [Cellulophaga baltica]